MRSAAKIARAALMLTALCVAGCAGDEDEARLPGERLSILELQRNLEPDSDALEAQGFIAPVPWDNEFWPQAGGYPAHNMQHLALGAGPLKRGWSVSIGEGASKTLPLTAQPVVVDGRIFAVDAKGMLSAFSIDNGKKLWSADIRDKGEDDDDVIGGGIAYSRGALYATAGYDEVLALDPANGQVLWRKKIPAPSRAAPTILEDKLFVTTLDNRVLALDSATGAQLWEYAGVSQGATLVGAASPAADADIVVPGFSSGELFALHPGNGAQAWAENLSSLRGFGGLGGMSDIRGLPVIDKGLVIAVSFGGRLAAIDARSGDRIWQREIGSAETPWVAGNHLFVLSTENELVALGRDNGTIRWVQPLPRFEDPGSRDGPIFWTAPILAGGRLILAANDGAVWEFAPEDGTVLRQWSAEGPVSITPVIAGGTLYVLTDDGALTAYR